MSVRIFGDFAPHFCTANLDGFNATPVRVWGCGGVRVWGCEGVRVWGCDNASSKARLIYPYSCSHIYSYKVNTTSFLQWDWLKLLIRRQRSQNSPSSIELEEGAREKASVGSETS